MHYVTTEQYTGLVKECTIEGCDREPKYVTTLDGSTAPGNKQVSCFRHIGTVSQTMLLRATAPTGDALAWVEHMGYEFRWRDDWSVGDHTIEYDCYEDGGPETCEMCVLVDTDSMVLASLGCIDDADDEYRREVELQLAAEVMT